MKVDIGFWDINGNYIEDIQEIGAEEMDKEFFNDIDNMVKVNKLEQENAELKAENERLNRCIMEELHHEGNAIREAIKYKQTLQEIKAIAEAPKPFIDFSETKTAIEVEYDYAAICKELELRLYKVLELITKAESEG